MNIGTPIGISHGDEIANFNIKLNDSSKNIDITINPGQEFKEMEFWIDMEVVWVK